jgi:hypothetical protein
MCILELRSILKCKMNLCSSIFFMLSTITFFIGGFLVLFGCTDAFGCPMYTYTDANVTGVHSVDFITPKGVHIQCTNQPYNYSVGQSVKIWVYDLDYSCGISNDMESVSLFAYIYLLLSSGFFFIALCSLCVCVRMS